MIRKSNNKSQLYISNNGANFTPISLKSKSPSQFKSTRKINILSVSPISATQFKQNKQKFKELQSKSPKQQNSKQQLASKPLTKKQIEQKLKQMINAKNLQSYKNQHLYTTPIASCKNNQPHSYLLPLNNISNYNNNSNSNNMNKAKKLSVLNKSTNIKTPKQSLTPTTAKAITPIQSKKHIKQAICIKTGKENKEYKDYKENKENIPANNQIIKKSAQNNNNQKQCSPYQCQRLSIKLSKQLCSCSLNSPNSNTNTYRHTYFVSELMNSVLSSVPLGEDQKLDLWREQFLQLLHSVNIMRSIQEEWEMLSWNRRKKKTIVFDLDETLVFCSENRPEWGTDTIEISIDSEMKNYLTFRPFLKKFIHSLLPYYHLCIFTASQPQYANCIIKALTQFIECEDAFEQIFTRDQCTEMQPNIYIKDIRKFQIPLSDIVIIDNVVYSFAKQIDNGIPIKNFQGESEDCQLIELAEYLSRLKEENDVRNLNRNVFKIRKFMQEDDPEKVIKENFPFEWEYYMNQYE